MTKVLVYKHFLGCKSLDEVKKQYRKLAFQHHPDKNGGKDATFKELAAEYEFLCTPNASFPVSNAVADYAHLNGIEDFEAAAKAYKYAETMGGFYNKMNKQHNANKSAEEIYWMHKKANDSNYEIINSLVDIAATENKTGNWFLMEVFKLDDLDLDHFKYCRFVLRKVSSKNLTVSEDWVATSYRNYVAIRNTNWTPTR
jgi:hypothetical protein